MPNLSMRRLTRPAFALAILWAFGTAPAGAQPSEDDPLIGDRPDFTESAITIAPGRFQLEAGVTHSQGDEEDVDELGEILVRIGLSRRVELRLGLPSYLRIEGQGASDVTGFSDAELGAKIAIAESWGWTTAVLIGTSLPTGSSELRESSLQPGALLAAERDLSPRISLGTNVGYVYSKAGGERHGEVLASVATGIGLGETTGLFVELFGTIPESAGGPETYFLDAGLTRLLSPDFQLDIRAGVGLNSAADDFFAGAGLIWRH